MITKEMILKVVCDRMNVTNEDIIKSSKIKGSRIKEFCQARQLCMAFAYKYSIGTLFEIGRFYGGYDHATVLHAKKAVMNDYDTCKTYRIMYEIIKKDIEDFNDKGECMFLLSKDLSYDYPSVEICEEALSYQTQVR
jgi:chromosomal replication initiator protein